MVLVCSSVKAYLNRNKNVNEREFFCQELSRLSDKVTLSKLHIGNSTYSPSFIAIDTSVKFLALLINVMLDSL